MTKARIILGVATLAVGGAAAATKGNPARYAQAVKEEGCPFRAMAAMWGANGAACPTGAAAAAGAPNKVQMHVTRVADGVEVRLTSKDRQVATALQDRAGTVAERAAAAQAEGAVAGNHAP